MTSNVILSILYEFSEKTNEKPIGKLQDVI